MGRADASTCPTCGVRSYAVDGETERRAFDGYHDFEELYEHRIRLWIALCHAEYACAMEFTTINPSWRSRKHSDGSGFEGWFVLGLIDHQGRQITYHLPDRFWDDCEFAETLEKGPEFDGHTSADVLDRLKELARL